MTIKNNLLNRVAKVATTIDKKHAHAILKRIIDSNGDFDGDDLTINLTVKDLATLYAAFLPPVKVKQGVFDYKWVSKALNKKDVRGICHVLHSDGETLYGTNGHIVFFIPTTLPNGQYDLYGNITETGSSTPDFKRVTPIIDDCKETRISFDDLKLIDNGETISKDIRFEYLFPTGHSVNQKYLDLALNGCKEFTYYFEDDDRSPILVELPDNAKAVIMPTRRKVDKAN